MIYAAETITVYLGSEVNMKVKHRTLPIKQRGYLIILRKQAIPSLNTFRTLINGISDGIPRRLPYANFSLSLIKILDGQIIGTIDRIDKVVELATGVYLGLIEVFQSLDLLA
jgi:hypothetical protein